MEVVNSFEAMHTSAYDEIHPSSVGEEAITSKMQLSMDRQVGRPLNA